MAGVVPGSSVVVLGGGVIGLLVVQLARLAGAAKIVLSTRNPAKRALGERVGATASVDPGAIDPVVAIAGSGGLIPGGADAVFECAGVGETVAQAPMLARKGGAAVVLGVMPQGERVAIEPFDLVFREIRLFGSFVNPFTHARAAALVASGALEIEALITRRVGLSEAAGLIAQPPEPWEVKTLIVA